MEKYGVVKNGLGPIPATEDEKAHFKSAPEYITSLRAETQDPGSNPWGQMILLFISHLQSTLFKDFKVYNYVQTSSFAGSKQDTFIAAHNNTHTAGSKIRTSMWMTTM
jgi:hypothetical protein